MWRWNGSSDVEVQCVAKAMEAHCPQKRRSTGASYTDIARQWLQKTPVEVLKNRRYTGKQLGYQLSLVDIRTNFGYRYTVDGKTNLWLYWFTKNFPLWTEIQKGNNITGKVTEVMIEFDMQQALKDVPPQEIMNAWLTEVENLTQKNTDKKYLTHDIYIDLDNLQRYIYRTEEDILGANGKLKKQLEINLAEATIIEGMAIAYDQEVSCDITGKSVWAIPQVYYDCPVFYRRYYTSSIRLQGMHSKLREVVVGKGYAIDLDTSVYAFYKFIAQEAGICSHIITEMSENKNRFRANIADCLQNTFESRRLKVTKTALTSLGFGAQTGYKGAVGDIIKNSEDLKAFNAHPKVIELKQFMKLITKFVKDNFKDDVIALGDDFRQGRGYNYKKFLAKMYQNYETNLVKLMMESLEQQHVYTVLWVHDGIYVRDKFDSMELNRIVQEFNPHASITVDKIGKWSGVRKSDYQQDELAHQQRMAEQERIAQQKYHNPLKETPAELTRRLQLQRAMAQEPTESYEERHSYFYED